MAAKTVDDVMTELRAQGITLSLPNTCRLINEAVAELASRFDTAIMPIELTINATAGTPSQIPTIGIVEVLCDGVPYKHFKADPYSITFEHDGEYKVKVLMQPDLVSQKEDEIPVHEVFHPAVVYYVADHAQPLAPDGRPKDNSTFYSLAQAADNRLSRIKRKRDRVPHRVWR